MKTKFLVPVILLAGMLCLTGCGSSSDDGQASENESQEEQDDQADADEGQEDGEEEETDRSDAAQDASEDGKDDGAGQQIEPGTANIMIYFGNDDATGFDSESVEIPSLSPADVLDALIEKGTIAADIEIVSFAVLEIDEKTTIELDFTSAFATYLSNMGSTGEYYIIGSVCNTFLDAYDCEQIKITVEGEDLSTGHAEYPGYLTTFE